MVNVVVKEVKGVDGQVVDNNQRKKNSEAPLPGSLGGRE